MSRVLVAISGGVDSSVAAWLLRELGHDVIGAFMRHGRRADETDARRVARSLDIELHVLDFQQQFSQVIDYFVGEYTRGRTPNPCAFCNANLKFGALLEFAASVDAQYLATGHHARLAKMADGHTALLAGRDSAKDQSYFLFGIRRDKLDQLLLPVGEHRKDDIRRMAGKLGLHAEDVKESQEICFVPNDDHAQFVKEHRGTPGGGDADTSGQIVTTEGVVVGQHDGIERFTIGQRKGLGVALGEPRYVVRIEPITHRVVIGHLADLARSELTVAGANWLIEGPTEPFRCQVKLRYRSQPVEATINPLADARFHVRLDEPFRAVAPGQAAVLYQSDRVLGGGWIE